jgi:diguanylate cyclase (GGDEF)-like protein
MDEDAERTQPDPRPTARRRDFVRRFFIQVTAVLVVFTTLGFLAMYLRTEALLSAEALSQARSYVDLVTTVRAWNAHYEGVYVEKGPGVESNPYLLKLGLKPDITTTDGRVFTMRNPALMTREVSGMLLAQDGAAFRLTSLNPVNPANAPDDWERGVLTSFEQGVKEAWITERTSELPVMHYLRPLVVESSCLTCHAAQGYRVGDIRGAVSVTVPLASERQTLRENAFWLVVAMLGSTAVLLGLTYVLVRRLSGGLEDAERTLVRLATTDELTGIWNRHQTFELLRVEMERARRRESSVALIMADVDHFKSVNDTLGHAAGDAVLAQIADRVAAELRPYDIFGRFGGEEFLIVAPDADLGEAVEMAERVRKAVAGSPMIEGDGGLVVTLSAGVSSVDLGQTDAPDRALARADRALYISKHKGRDRVTAIDVTGNMVDPLAASPDEDR